MIRFHDCLALLVLLTTATASAGQQADIVIDRSGDSPFERDDSIKVRGPLEDVSYEILWLIESDDANRKPYSGPARIGLTQAGFHRLVHAGSVRSSVTIGQKSVASAESRFGPISVSTSMLNTTEENELQIKIDLHTKTKAPIGIDTTVRVPLDHWFLLAAVDSRIGVPLHKADGNRSILIMRITDGVQLLD